MSGKQETYPSEAMAQNAVQAAKLLKQLANAKRLEILCALVKGEKSVGELSVTVSLSQSAVSQHLAKMKGAGLVASEKRGPMVYYTLSGMEVSALLSTLYLIYCRD